jgi:hypothetical protein
VQNDYKDKDKTRRSQDNHIRHENLLSQENAKQEWTQRQDEEIIEDKTTRHNNLRQDYTTQTSPSTNNKQAQATTSDKSKVTDLKSTNQFVSWLVSKRFFTLAQKYDILTLSNQTPTRKL